MSGAAAARRGAIAARRRAAGGGAATPQFLTSARSRPGSGTSNSIGVIPGTRGNDVLVAFAGSGSQSGLTPPSGWTLLADTTQDAARLYVYARLCNAANQDAGVWTWSGAGGHTVSVVAYRGYKLPTIAGAARSDGPAGAVAPSLIAPANSVLLLGGYFVSGGSNANFASTTVRSAQTNGSLDGLVSEQLRPDAGATGSRTLVLSSSAGASAAGSLILERV